MSVTDVFNFEEFCKANPARPVDGYDYVHAICKSVGLPGDFLIWYAKLVCPDIMKIDGMVFISDLYDEKKYKSLISEGETKEHAQVWMNLLEITGLFDYISDAQVLLLAEKIAEGWTAKIRQVFGENCEGARVIANENTGEVFVVVGQSS